MAGSKVAAVRVPMELLEEVDRRVGRRRRSSFFVEAAKRELARLEQAEALAGSAGAWRAEEHEELPNTVEGLGELLRRMRDRSDRLR